MNADTPRPNCTLLNGNRCMHGSAPRAFLGVSVCVLMGQKDPRITECAFRSPCAAGGPLEHQCTVVVGEQCSYETNDAWCFVKRHASN